MIIVTVCDYCADLGLAHVTSRCPGHKVTNILHRSALFHLDIVELQQSDCGGLQGSHGPLRKGQEGRCDLGYHQALGVQGTLWDLQKREIK